MQRTKELVTSVSKRLMRRGLSTLPDRYHWEIAARLPISNLGLPVTPEDDLWESGEEEVDKILSHVGEYDKSFDIESSTILDIGCGAGRLLVPMASKGANAYGIDASRGFLNQCETNAEEFGVTVTLARCEDEIPEFGTAFDLIFCVKTFQSLRRRIMLKYLRESYRNLADGGILYVTLSDLESLANQRQLFEEEIDDVAPFRNRYFTRGEVRLYLEYIGYTDVQFLSDKVPDIIENQFIILAKK